MKDLNCHPHMVMLQSEFSIDHAFEQWVKQVEKLLGHSLDGDHNKDGYSLDIAADAWYDGFTPQEFVRED